MSPERYQRIVDVLNQRQPDLSVCLEMVHKNNNLAAIVRTADAVGAHHVHAALEDDPLRLSMMTSTGTQHWVNFHQHASIHAACDNFRAQGMQILATHLSADAVDFRDIDYTKPTVLLVGNEKDGLSEAALQQADHNIVIPMMGMAQSLNVSVAAALIMYEAQRQRQVAGMYDQPRLPRSEYQRLLFERGHPVFARVCKQKNMPYPEIDEHGEILAPESWWQQIQMTEKAWRREQTQEQQQATATAAEME